MATSTYILPLSKTDGTKLTGFGGCVYLVPSGDAVNNTMPMLEDTTRPGQYYRENVSDGEYKIYIDTDKSGAPVEGDLYKRSDGTAYKLWIGENKLSMIADQFEEDNGYKLKGGSIKDGSITNDKIDDDTITTQKLRKDENASGYMYALVDSQKKILFAIKEDGSVYWKEGMSDELKSMFNLIGYDGIKILSTNDFTDELKGTVSLSKLTDAEEYSYCIKDQNKNIIFGIKKDGQVVGVINSHNLPQLMESAEWIYAIVDKNKRVIFGVKEDGTVISENSISRSQIAEILTELSNIQENIQNKPVGSLYGKEFYVLGDSLSTGGIWQNKLAELSGATYDNAKNINVTAPLSIGGTAVIGNSENCGQMRARNLVNNYPDAKVVIIENINDLNVPAGGITDVPFMLSTINNYPDQGLTSSAAAESYWSNNFAAIVGGYTAQKGACINIPYYGSGKNLKVTGVASKDGIITLTVNGTQYSIEVLSTHSITDIVTKILEYQYGLVTDSPNADGVSVDFYYSDGVTLTFADTDNTGVLISITDTDTAQIYLGKFFIGETSEWANSAKWVNSVSLYAAYRGLLEYLQTELPTTEIYWFIPTRYGIALSSYIRADGTPDLDAYNASWSYQVYDVGLVLIQRNVCELYKIKYLDVNASCGITLYNLLSYYYESNVHPKIAGYDKWGETINNLIK